MCVVRLTQNSVRCLRPAYTLQNALKVLDIIILPTRVLVNLEYILLINNKKLMVSHDLFVETFICRIQTQI